MTHSDCWIWDRSDIELDFDAIVQVALAFGWRPPTRQERQSDDDAGDRSSRAFGAALRCALQTLLGNVTGGQSDCSAKEMRTRKRALDALGSNGTRMIRAYMEFCDRQTALEACRSGKCARARADATDRPMPPWARLVRVALAFGWRSHVNEKSIAFGWIDAESAGQLIDAALNCGPAHHSLIAALRLALAAAEASPEHQPAALSVDMADGRSCDATDLASRCDLIAALNCGPAAKIRAFLEIATEELQFNENTELACSTVDASAEGCIG